MSLISWNIRFYCASLKLYSMKIHLSLTNVMREKGELDVLLDFSLTVKAATLIFISGRCSAISSAKQGKSGSIYNLVKN